MCGAKEYRLEMFEFCTYLLGIVGKYQKDFADEQES
jgi:hypothetical protein